MIDIAIIGGGVNGLAIAREAACRGLSVTLVERHDICDGATRATSHMIHGGLKYLENLEFRLVWESIREQRRLLRNAPHLVHTSWMLVPWYRGARRSGRLIRCGTLLHDLMSLAPGRPRSRGLSVRDVVRHASGISTNGLRGGALFQDAQVSWPQRLCVELMLDAEREGATILTHAAVTGFLRDGDAVTGVTYRDPDTGESAKLAARVTVNVTGPWIDTVLAGQVPSPRLSGGTKGSHLVIAGFDGAPDVGLFFEARRDGRPVFIVPWNGQYLLGSTDLTYDGDLDDVRIDADEIAYLLDEANQLFPEANLGLDDVRFAYSGVRPLPYVEDVAANAKISRDHRIVTHSPHASGLLTVVGGKLTTHRALAEDVIDKVVSDLGITHGPSPTPNRRLPGAPDGDWEDFVRGFLGEPSVLGPSVPVPIAQSLLRTHGTRARDVVTLMTTAPLALICDPDERALAAEVTLAVRQEKASTLADVLLRRLPHRIGAHDESAAVPTVACQVMADLLGWDAGRQQQEIRDYTAELARVRGLPDPISEGM